MINKNKNKIKTNLRNNRITREFTVKELIENYIDRIDLDADYQREKVWSQKQQEELLDSIIRDIDIPKLYLAEVKGNKQFDYECVDGKQRMLTLRNFIKPDKGEKGPLLIDVLNKKYTYRQLKNDHPNIAKGVENFKLNFIIYNLSNLNDDFVREIFRRLQLGIRLNSGEILNAHIGAMREFVFKEIGKDGPFIKNTNLSAIRYSRQFTLAQICINSFNRKSTDDFVRARLSDLENFFDVTSKLEKNDENLLRIREVLKIMDKEFGDNAANISSRAIAVSAYLFIEDLILNKNKNLVSDFVVFFLKLLEEINTNMNLIRKYEKPKNNKLIEEFQKYILQASVEPSSIRRRNEFLKEAFNYYSNTATKGKIIGSSN